MGVKYKAAGGARIGDLIAKKQNKHMPIYSCFNDHIIPVKCQVIVPGSSSM